jgi:hypothetical protein
VRVPNAPLSMTADALVAVGSDMGLLGLPSRDRLGRGHGRAGRRRRSRRAGLRSKPSECRVLLRTAGVPVATTEDRPDVAAVSITAVSINAVSIDAVSINAVSINAVSIGAGLISAVLITAVSVTAVDAGGHVGGLVGIQLCGAWT